MTELDADARQRGNAAIAVLRKALEDAECRVRRFSDDLAHAEEKLGMAQAEAQELCQALVKLRGGDCHEG